MWVDNANGGSWTFTWRRRLFVWEENLLIAMRRDLDNFTRSNEEDEWCWKLYGEEMFTVKSLYSKLEGEGREEGTLSVGERYVFRNIWKAGAPSKVSAFVWKALHDRIPTRRNLEFRHCLPPEIGSNCVWCMLTPECTSHIFLHCDMATKIWMKLMSWLDLNFIMSPDCLFSGSVGVVVS